MTLTVHHVAEANVILASLEGAAMDLRAALARTNDMDHDAAACERMRLRDSYADMVTRHGVTVRVTFPENRTAYRKPHARYQYYWDGMNTSRTRAVRKIAEHLHLQGL